MSISASSAKTCNSHRTAISARQTALIASTSIAKRSPVGSQRILWPSETTPSQVDHQKPRDVRSADTAHAACPSLEAVDWRAELQLQHKLLLLLLPAAGGRDGNWPSLKASAFPQLTGFGRTWLGMHWDNTHRHVIQLSTVLAYTTTYCHSSLCLFSSRTLLH